MELTDARALVKDKTDKDITVRHLISVGGRGLWPAAWVRTSTAGRWPACSMTWTRTAPGKTPRGMPTWRLTVTVTDPGTRVVYYKSPAAVARYAEPTATGRLAIRYNPATDATIEVRYPASTPTWQQLGLQVTGPGGAACRSAPTGLAFAMTSPPASSAGRSRPSRP
jgi:hypothetical protein